VTQFSKINPFTSEPYRTYADRSANFSARCKVFRRRNHQPEQFRQKRQRQATAIGHPVGLPPGTVHCQGWQCRAPMDGFTACFWRKAHRMPCTNATVLQRA